MNKYVMQSFADKINLGDIIWEDRTAINTGQVFQVGYVYKQGRKTLFCKRQPYQQDYYLCNEFRDIDIQRRDNK